MKVDEEQNTLTMKKRILPVMFLVVASVITDCSSGGYAAQFDHLIPVSGTVAEDWLNIIDRKLSVTHSDCGRSVSLSSDPTDGEYSVAIYSDPKSQTGFSVTYTKAASNLGYAIWPDNEHRRSPDEIGVTRIDAAIPRSTATGVKAAWQHMIQRVRPMTKSDLKGQGIILHATTFRISIGSERDASKTGILPPYAKGPRTNMVRDVTKLLVKYCEAKTDMRADVAKEIESDAKHIIEK